LTLLYGGERPTYARFQGFQGASVTLNFNTIAEAQKLFDKLAAGGRVAMAFAPSFWAKGLACCSTDSALLGF
jgi:PhnB protein